MKTYSFDKVELTGGFLKSKERLNRKETVAAVYDRFAETGRIGAFNFDYHEGDELKPHIFWDSDVAKWIESVAYVLKKEPDADLEQKADAIIENVRKHQCPDGYFNIYYTVVAPAERWSNRDKHELYCAGHMMEAAVAYADATGKTTLLECMERYADYIYRIFVEEDSAAFRTPGHEEIEIALIKMYRYTGKRKYLELSAHFLNARGAVEEPLREEYYQSHRPVREQNTAVGHAVRAMYLYTGMALLAKETGDETLLPALNSLWEDVTLRKMYVTGGIGSTFVGEAFTKAYDLPNDGAYTETCASIGLMLFADAMLNLDTNAKYADVIERALYNGMLSGLSLDGTSFFYENPLEINLLEHIPDSRFGKRKFPITQRVRCFRCSCCPPNITRILSTLGNYVYGRENDTLYINQFVSSTLSDGVVSANMVTDYPRSGTVRLMARGMAEIAIRIPAWCDSFTLNRPYRMENGYAIVENDGGELCICFDMTPHAVFADSRVLRDAHQLTILRGPIVYCAESVDNGADLHSVSVSPDFTYTEEMDESIGLYALTVPCKRRIPDPDEAALYSRRRPRVENGSLRLIPYHAFANRGESDMRVWLFAD